MAIDFKELRFGNIVHYEGTEPEYGDEEDVVIGSISEGELMGYAYSCYHGIDCQKCYHINKPAFFSPLPLTSEWLYKLGYYSDTEFTGTDVETVPFYTNESSLVLDFHSFAPSWQGIELELPHKLEHIHQLQNLYQSLTGEELQIKEA